MDQIYWAIFLQLSHKLTQLQKCGPNFLGYFHTFVSKAKQLQKCVAGHFYTLVLKEKQEQKRGPNLMGHVFTLVSKIPLCTSMDQIMWAIFMHLFQT